MMNNFKNIFDVRLKNKEEDKPGLTATAMMHSNGLHKNFELSVFCSQAVKTSCHYLTWEFLLHVLSVQRHISFFNGK